MHRLLFVLLLVVLPACHLPVYRPPAPERFGPPGHELFPGERLRLAVGGSYKQGALVRWDSTRIVLSSSQWRDTTLVAAVDTAWRYRENPAKGPLAIVGGVAGAMGGLVIAYLQLGDRTDTEAGVLAAALIFGGAALGGVLGYQVAGPGSWRLTYLRPAPQPAN